MDPTSQDVERQLWSSEELNMKNIDEEIKKQKLHQVTLSDLIQLNNRLTNVRILCRRCWTVSM